MEQIKKPERWWGEDQILLLEELYRKGVGTSHDFVFPQDFDIASFLARANQQLVFFEKKNLWNLSKTKMAKAKEEYDEFSRQFFLIYHAYVRAHGWPRGSDEFGKRFCEQEMRYQEFEYRAVVGCFRSEEGFM